MVIKSRDSLAYILENQKLEVQFQPIELINRDFTSDWHLADSSQWMIKPFRQMGFIQTNNFGSPLQANRDQLELVGHLDEGFHNTDFFHQRADRLFKIKTNKAYSELNVDQGLFPGRSQTSLIDNLTVYTLLSVPFRKSFHFNFYYNRINHQGIYANNQNYISTLGSSLHWENPNGKQKLAINLASNTDKLQYNWGISDSTSLDDPRYNLRETIEVRSRSSNSRLKNGQIGAVYSIKLSSFNEFIEPAIKMDAYYHYNTISYTDANPRSILNQYGPSFYQDSAVIHRYFSNHGLWSSAEIQIFNHSLFNLSGILKYDYNKVFFDSTVHNQIHFIKSGLNLVSNYSNFKLNVQFYQINQNHHSGYSLNSRLSYLLKDSSSFSINYLQESKLPSLLEQTLLVNKRFIWQNYFNNSIHKEFTISYLTTGQTWPSLNVRFAQIDQFIYLDKTLNFIQSPNTINQLHLKAQWNFKYKFITSQHILNCHILKPDPTGWTGLYSYHDLIFKLKFFGRYSKIQFGPNIQIFKLDNKLGFHPLFGQYFKSDESNNKKIRTILGANVGLILNEFRINLNFDQIESFWTDRMDLWVKNYPIYDFGIRLGIQWKLLN
ncbi:MAG: hypothetical protein IPH93_10120 [Saprospiraceae bacterium]|nr:hypothetical protein [Saprospiraceae bacterium]